MFRYAKSAAVEAEHARYHVAPEPPVVPEYLVKLAQDISEMQLAWRDMDEGQKAECMRETIRKAKGLGQ